MLHNWFKLIIALWFGLTASIALAEVKVIRDSEIEEAIALTVAPLKKAANLPHLKIYLLDDDEPNAFVIGGETVFITSGLIAKFPDPDVLRGVVAHEIGHILGRHSLRVHDNLDIYRNAAIAATAAGLAIGIGTGNLDLAFGTSLVGQHGAERNFLSHNRVLESSADQTAMKLLERSGHSAVGLIDFFTKTLQATNMDIFSPYDLTHPLSRDRLLIIKSFNNRSGYQQSQNSAALKASYSRASAKLAAFTMDTKTVINLPFIQSDPELKHYVNAIRFFRMGRFDDALHHVNKLIMRQPKNAFYRELKGQILFDQGKKTALIEYNTAVELRPNDVMIRLGRAIVGMERYMDKPMALTTFYRDLKFVRRADPDNTLALFYFAKYYEKRGLKGEGALYSGLINAKFGRRKLAKMHAKEALNHLRSGTPEWYEAKDLLHSAELQDE